MITFEQLNVDDWICLIKPQYTYKNNKTQPLHKIIGLCGHHSGNRFVEVTKVGNLDKSGIITPHVGCQQSTIKEGNLNKYRIAENEKCTLPCPYDNNVLCVQMPGDREVDDFYCDHGCPNNLETKNELV